MNRQNFFSLSLKIDFPSMLQSHILSSYSVRPWNFFPGEYLPLTSDLNGFKATVKRQCYVWVLSNLLSYILFIFVIFFFLVPPCLAVVVQV